MKQKIKNNLYYLVLLRAVACSCVVLLYGCAAQRPVTANPAARQTVVKTISSLRFINEWSLPHNLEYKQTIVGGLSGIDYDVERNLYYLISDDRSHKNPARFYTATIAISDKGIDSVSMTGVNYLRQQNGETYPELGKHVKLATDPEAMRYHVPGDRLYWTSEGDRVIKPSDTVLIDPTITSMTRDGKYADTVPLPENLHMQLKENGPRRNGVLEGLTFADNYRSLVVSMEEPLFQDGPQSAVTANDPFVRFYKFDLKTNVNVAQYAYKLAPVAFPSPLANGSAINGVSDILWLGNNKLLVTERSYTEGRPGTNIKVFVADLNGADNVLAVKSLIATPPKHPLKKRLLLDMDQLGIYIDNIEGATFGPLMANGHQTLIFVADNNFNDKEKAQFLLFEVIP